MSSTVYRTAVLIVLPCSLLLLQSARREHGDYNTSWCCTLYCCVRYCYSRLEGSEHARYAPEEAIIERMLLYEVVDMYTAVVVIIIIVYQVLRICLLLSQIRSIDLSGMIAVHHNGPL